ncbi:unnamed protein product [Cercopithifilaria johnstoni]|uniref:Uncharacterized protein n=1 Tax=Cercopithifilaria johnstoni TaxID=2874296 RepID=A0A8J2QB60_9BILA|nr:unnamed protein product [Cercopithifilaria johnstoni]
MNKSFADGRRIIDGKVVNGKEPHEMWCNLLINLFIKNIARRSDVFQDIRNIHERRNEDRRISPLIFDIDKNSLSLLFSRDSIHKNDTMMKPILPKDALDSEATMLTAMSNSKKKQIMGNKMTRFNGNNEDEETYSD